MADIPLVQLPYPEEETRTFELSTSLSPNWDKNGRIYYTDETGQVVRPQTKYNPLQMLGRRLKAFGSNAKNFVEDFNMDKSHTYFAPFEDINEQYKAGNIDKSELPYLAQGRAEQEIRDAQQQERDNINRGWLGTGLSAASMHPIFNIPYVGTGLGGAMYDLGQGITEGNNADELWDRTKRGFAIGESVGAIPYVGKLAGKTKAGQAVGSVLNKAGERFANSKLYDALMTDVRAFNPNKQTVYHGSPYDFNKFSNEAIGTGEGAQAHGYGHYAALDKDIADKNYRQALTGDDFDNMKYFYKNAEVTNRREKAIIASILENGKENVVKVREKNLPRYKYDEKEYNQKLKELDFVKNINENLIRKDTDKGQLYKLSVPKDDVMLREDLPLNQQPQEVKNAIDKYFRENYQGNPNDYNFEKSLDIYNDLLGVNNGGKFYKSVAQQELSKFNKNPEKYKFKPSKIDLNNSAEQYELAAKKLNDLGIKGISYNGGIDGEARVIFNPDDIEIIRKYYNQPGLFEQLTGASNSGAAVDSLYNKIAR